VRLDLALHGLRLFKSRSQAQAAIAAGHVLLNGERTKPSHEVRVGDRVTLTTESGPRTVEVLELPARSLSKEAAKARVREVSGGASR
jgi:ribosome-associated heat shock protein Hsp15